MYFIGCDVSKATLDVVYPCTGHRPQHQCVRNQPRGWDQLIARAEASGQACTVVMEATGVYHLKVAAYLVQAGLRVWVVNPGRSADYARSQNQFNKTDTLDARSLQRYGASLKTHHDYRPDSALISELKTLLSRLKQLATDIQRERNRLEKCDYLAGSGLLRASIKRLLRCLIKERTHIQQRIDKLIATDPALGRNQRLMCSIKGIGKISSQWLLPLLHEGRFDSARQVAAFLGLVPRHARSGTSLHARPKISRRGNPTLRAKLYMPAVTASVHNPELRTQYLHLINQGKTEKQALIALMRKLVHLCYGVVKHQTPYQTNYAA